MLKEALASAYLLDGPKLALIIFSAFMLLLLAWIFRPRSKEIYNTIGNLAINDEGGAHHEQ